LGNQQERLETLSPEFLGGLFTGEAWFGLFVHRKRQNTRLGVVITPGFYLAMKDIEAVALVRDTLDRHGFPQWGAVNDKRGVSTVSMSGRKKMIPFCEWIIPHLRGDKRRSAELTLEYCRYRASLPHQSPITEADLDFVSRSRELTGGNGWRKTVELEELSRILRDYTPSTRKGEDIVRSHVKA